jgi:hypothetical protein
MSGDDRVSVTWLSPLFAVAQVLLYCHAVGSGPLPCTMTGSEFAQNPDQTVTIRPEKPSYS